MGHPAKGLVVTEGGLKGADRTWHAFPLDHFSPLELSQGNVRCQVNLPLLSPNHIAHD